MDAPLTSGADLALAESYREWWELCRQERLGALPTHADCAAVLRAIRQAEALCSAPTLVYEVALGRWWMDYGEEP